MTQKKVNYINYDPKEGKLYKPIAQRLDVVMKTWHTKSIHQDAR
jgi:hypothetical protein